MSTSTTATGAERPPSRTAMMTALGRAIHLFHHGRGALLDDWLAWPLVGPEADTIVDSVRPLVGEHEVPVATWLAGRARLAEDWLAQSGADQYVVLGAGLDSFAWRQTGDVTVFEVDHAGSQTWKRSRSAALGLPQPSRLSWVPVDFQEEGVAPALGAAGLDASRPVFVSWLGVIPYLTRPAVLDTLRQLPPCSLAVGYLPPDAAREEDSRPLGRVMEGVVEAVGEPWITMTTPAEFAELLAEAGFSVVEDLGARDIEPRYGLPALNYERMALATNVARS